MADANYLVAYEATPSGQDALALGIAMARLTGVQLRLALVVPHSVSEPAEATEGSSSYFALLRRQAGEWLAEALERVPADVTASAHVLWGESTSEVLLVAASEFQSVRIIVGAARGGVLGRFTIGSIANELLHASPIPVALAPAGYVAPDAISRVTCVIGTRAGWQVLLDSFADIADGLDVDLRFVTLVEVRESKDDTAGRDHLERVRAVFADRVSADVAVEVASGKTTEDAVEALDWRPDEIALVGSSRLAQHGRIFLGATAHRILHALPVPLIVVPTTAPREAVS